MRTGLDACPACGKKLGRGLRERKFSRKEVSAAALQKKHDAPKTPRKRGPVYYVFRTALFLFLVSLIILVAGFLLWFVRDDLPVGMAQWVNKAQSKIEEVKVAAERSAQDAVDRAQATPPDVAGAPTRGTGGGAVSARVEKKEGEDLVVAFDGDLTGLEDLRAVVEPRVKAMKALRKEFIREVEKAGVDHLFDFGRLAADERFLNSYAILNKIDSLEEEYVARARAMIDDYREAVAATPLPEKLLAAYREALDAQAQKEENYWDEAKELSDAMSISVRQMIFFLHETRAVWKIENERIVFERSHDVVRFQEKAEEMKGLHTQWTTMEERFLNEFGVPMFPEEVGK